MDKKIKGERAEAKFKVWLDRNNIPYWYIQQDLKTFSPSLKRYFIGRRPDFMILLPHLGFILVDVEHKEVGNKHNVFMLDCEESIEYSNLQRNFNLEVWYALSNEHSDYQTWYWCPVSRVLEKGKQFERKLPNTGNYFALNLSEFTQIAFDDSLDRLFSKLLLSEFQKK